LPEKDPTASTTPYGLGYCPATYLSKEVEKENE